ncbi:ATP-binding SpoIIE family protein phosphatase [Rufibacter glacialis]|uniref:SpoIIE family protein phosphatase n=1 Tax=Rufibacter glacialis TaxID=1259555 RepID=A0A5M8QEF1_9BACT|nr:ATP-binding SpoIIE family protein phosphatase [Rufibacter glacialis]KAA6433471.1 SpoIIE family protein phosphatase [Rufibacter glacialis]GGK73919.1 TorS-related protein [Rufibacter glacialis]
MDFNFEAHQQFSLPDRSFLNIFKRDITKIAEAAGFSATETGRVNLVVMEMATNLLKHAGTLGGELLVKPIFGENGTAAGLELLCLDNGPGMSDPQRMMQDGVSTYGSMGQGLGAIKRLSDFFDIYSQRGVGTVILSRIYQKKYIPKSAARSDKKFQVGAVLVPKAGEKVSGDAWGLRMSHEGAYLLTLDGLGHGEHAHEASLTALKAFHQQPKLTPSQMLRGIHAEIKKTRGAVGAIAHWNAEAGNLLFCGIGNISGRLIVPDRSKSLLSYNGTLGMSVPTTINDQHLSWERNNVMILHSDGLKTRWDLQKYPELTRHDPTLIAAVLYKDNTRTTDDTLVVVVRATE